jgi:hypothetical protein
MTNGEKIKEIFPDTKINTQYDNPFGDRFIVFTLNNEDMQVNIEWWNVEYKEPSNSEKPNRSVEEKCPCYHCEYFEIKGWSHCKIHEDAYGDSRCNDYRKANQGSNKVNQCLNKSEIPTGSTTKNDLGVDNQNIRLIDANALIKRLRPKHFDWWGEGEQDDFGKGNNSMLEEVIEAIEEFPSVTPIRPKGHWIWVFDETPSTPNSPYEVNYAGWVCSCCHKFPDDICEWDDPDEPPTYKFCPNCGSDNR